MRATRAIIHLDHFLENFRAVQKRVGPETRICVSIKADAYGHGALQIARAGVEAGAYCFSVATICEGAALREGGITAPVLLLSQPEFEEIPGIIENRLVPFVSDSDFAGALNHSGARAGIRLPVHLKVDTGMGRMGCSPVDAPGLAMFIAGCGFLEYAGTATHLAVSDSADPEDIAYTRKQIACFEKALADIRAAGLCPGIVHAANSGAVISHPGAWFDMVRPGIVLYGYKPVEEDAAPGGGQSMRVKPVMELRTSVVFIKKVRKGESLSYGRTWIARQDTNAAVLPVGYADGLPRLASNRWQVFIRNKTYPLVGRICMDQCLADLGPGTDVRRWDEASVFGGPAAGASLLAERIGTIPYEITCNINRRVPRVYAAGAGDF